MSNFIITHTKDHRLVWSNDLGWVSSSYAFDLFTEDDKRKMSLPMEGEWAEMHWHAGGVQLYRERQYP